jgi:uncharacterized membrane protein
VAQTSVVPFAAVVAGRQRLVPAERPWGAMGAGLVIAAVLRWWHRRRSGRRRPHPN